MRSMRFLCFVAVSPPPLPANREYSLTFVLGRKFASALEAVLVQKRCLQRLATGFFRYLGNEAENYVERNCSV